MSNTKIIREVFRKLCNNHELFSGKLFGEEDSRFEAKHSLWGGGSFFVEFTLDGDSFLAYHNCFESFLMDLTQVIIPLGKSPVMLFRFHRSPVCYAVVTLNDLKNLKELVARGE